MLLLMCCYNIELAGWLIRGVATTPTHVEIKMDPGGSTSHFPFPFEPYAIQNDFMKSLYTTLEEGKIGLFESPTGTVSLCINIISANYHLVY